ncbi:MAG: 3-phosphoshikimate 1-carboxyvinyltransferase, partial [Phycisphaerae bacterium]|nr:3-phosphoshikimate 1-carboxyvinyltransferase [Phycisphaerae bacterium]
IGGLVDALRTLGAVIGYEGREGLPPLLVRGGGLRGGSVSLSDVVSSQFVSALLMAAPYAAGDVLIEIRGRVSSAPYLAMTLDVMRRMGVETLSEASAGGPPTGADARFIVPAPQRYHAASIAIEPDASGASYFWAAAAVSGGRVLVHGLHDTSVQGDVRFVHVLEQMGCRIEHQPEGIAVQGPEPGGLRGVDIDLNAMPDVVQTLAVVALFARGPTTIRNVANLRVKETDRLVALERELARLGAEITLGPDGLSIRPPATPRAATLDTHDDHRMAMSLAVAGLACEGVVIRDAGVVSKSLPEFFSLLNGLGR